MTDNDEFFRQQRASAVLKHGILKRYAVVFASAAGQNADRVVLLDGYAGRGQYEDGSPGSPRLLLESAAKVQAFRNISCVFVESDPDHFAELQVVVAENRPDGLDCQTLDGELGERLPTILEASKEAALFAFLDPFGTALAEEQLANQLLARPSFPPTDVLLHFSVGAIRRFGGIVRRTAVTGQQLTAAEAKSVERADRFLGGSWWHDLAAAAQDSPGGATEAAMAVAREYCKRVNTKTHFGWFICPVRRRPAYQPDYLMVLFTRHAYGNWRFNDALSKANVEWQNAWRGEANDQAKAAAEEAVAQRLAAGQPNLFDLYDIAEPTPDAEPPFDEAAEAEEWVRIIKQNLATILAEGRSIRPLDNTRSVYGTALGLGREQHVRKAIKQLHAEGLTSDNGIGKFWERTITPGASPTP